MCSRAITFVRWFQNQPGDGYCGNSSESQWTQLKIDFFFVFWMRFAIETVLANVLFRLH